MSLVRRNILANIVGSAWATLMSLAFVPLYIHFLGIEAYGLIGIFLALAAILSLLDLGLGTTLNRELAQLSVQSGSSRKMRDLVRTFEIVYWAIGLLAGLAVVLTAPTIAAYWIKAQQLPLEVVERAFIIMGFAIASQWPLALYNGGLSGLQRQTLLNTISAVMATVRNVGAALVLWRLSNTIEAFLEWNVAINLIHTVVVRIALWRSLPHANAPAAFRAGLLREVWRFAAGMTGISVMAVILTQLDKVILSKVLPLDAFGYYSLAWRVAAAIQYLVTPVTAAFFPRFSQLAVTDDRQERASLYHLGCQLISVVVLPVAIILALFPKELLLLWTLDPVIAANTGPILGLLAIGTAVNSMLSMPIALQFAHGRTRLVFLAGTVAVVLLAPLIYFLSVRHGGLGAAWAWLILNCGYLAFLARVMHHRLLAGHLREWLLADIGAPFAVALAVACLWKLALGVPDSYGWMFFSMAAVSSLTMLAAAVSARRIRAWMAYRVSAMAQRGGGS